MKDVILVSLKQILDKMLYSEVHSFSSEVQYTMSQTYTQKGLWPYLNLGTKNTLLGWGNDW